MTVYFSTTHASIRLPTRPRRVDEAEEGALLGTYLTAALFAATIHAQPLDQVKWAPEGISADDREFALAVASKVAARETRVQ